VNTTVQEDKPDANNGDSAVTDPGKDYAPVDDAAPGGAPGQSGDAGYMGMVRCRTCGMKTPSDGARCERCNTPLGPKQYNGQ
jgi:hypothetical protein